MLKKILIIVMLFSLNFNLSAIDPTIKMEPVINLDIAKIMADACEKDQKSNGYRPVNIAIVDKGGELVLFRRQNNAFLLSIDIAIKKAISSAGIPYPTRTIAEIVYGKDGKPGRVPGLVHSKNIVAFAGGLPIKTKNNKLLGGIGISGATGDEDEQCAKAAINAIQDYL